MSNASSNQKGKFIVVEGIDGSGKSTQCKMLKAKMEYLEIPTELTCECSHGPIGKVIRNDFLSGKRKSDPRITNLLYAIDRLDHITNEEDGMLQYIDKGIHVISDRYYLSSIAYYGSEFFGTPQFEEQVRFILEQNRMNRELMIPDITIVIDIDPSAAMERIVSGREGHAEIYETAEKLIKINHCYGYGIALLQGLGENIVRVDGHGEDWEVFNRVWKAVEPIIRSSS